MPEGKGTYGKKVGRPAKKETNKKDNPFKGLKEGALSKMLGIPVEKNIPKSLLKRLKKAEVGTVAEYKGKKIKITNLLHKRVNWAINFAK